MVSLVIRAWSDAGFIAAVLLVNAKTRVLRDGDTYVIAAEELLPGDIVLFEAGDKVPADLRLLSGRDLEVDESLLTGESAPVSEDAEALLTRTAPWATGSTWCLPGRW